MKQKKTKSKSSTAVKKRKKSLPKKNKKKPSKQSALKLHYYNELILKQINAAKKSLALFSSDTI